MSRNYLLAAVLFCLISAPALACLWDYDTLQQERSEFPKTLDLITGKFLRHSAVYYQWRVKDRIDKLEQAPNDLALIDDLAVAYDKLEQSEKAIEVMQRSLKIDPDRYETLANLGTFYIHSGQLEKGAEYIQKAIEINPDAHFGREKYQLLLVQYVLSKSLDGAKPPLPLSTKEFYYGEGPFETPEFIEFIMEQTGESDWSKLLKGIEGMMRFGHHDSPILLEALAETLVKLGHLRLATRVFLQASYVVESEAAKESYRSRAELVISGQIVKQTGDNSKLFEVEKKFLEELAEANEWFNDLKAKELEWCTPGSGFDPDQEFQKLYEKNPSVDSENARPDVPHRKPIYQNRYAPAVVFAILAFSVTGFAMYMKSLKT